MPTSDLISARAVVRMLRREVRLRTDAARVHMGHCEYRSASDSSLKATTLESLIPRIEAMAARARKRKAKG